MSEIDRICPLIATFPAFSLLAGIKDESNRPGVNKKNYCRTSLRKKRRESRRDIVFHSPGLPPR